MRSIRKLAATAALLVTTVVAVGPLPAGAAPGDPDGSEIDVTTDGGSSGNAIQASAGAFGGSTKGGRQCGWQRGWPTQTGSTSLVNIPSALTGGYFNPFGGLFDVLSSIFGSEEEQAQIRILTEQEALEVERVATETGEDAVIFKPIFGGDDEHIEIVEGLDSPLTRVLLILSGPQDLGVLINDPYSGDDPLLLDEGQLAGDHFLESDRYPMIQRGTDQNGDQLWWDPWFVSIDASATYGCAPGVVYSPRVDNPRILLPDILSVVTNLLPAVRPQLAPLDRGEGWAYVQVPTNFGVDSSSLEDKYAHAEVEYINPATGISESVWAEVHAVATHLVFNPGDGSETVVCQVADMPYDAANPGPCSHAYRDSSNIVPGKEFRATVSVVWSGIYRDSNGALEVVDIAPTAAEFGIAVAEARPSVSIDN